jgi:hypothetical protein
VISHYLAAAIILTVLVWHSAAGGKPHAIRVFAAERAAGRNSISERGHNIIWFSTVGFLIGSAIVLLLPSAPTSIEIAIGAVFIAVSLFDLVIQRGKKSGGYFAAIVGALILAGSLT